MSDAGRKGVLDQAQEKITPDSQKSTLDQAKESITGTYDRAAGAAQPSDTKSTSQKAADSVRSGSDDASNQSKGILQSAQETVGNAAQTVSDTLTGNTKK
ncbi:putative chaperone heat shock protein hsp12 protein [Neofusicoccum parvum UCRNP2]|uniref:Putative chaperone heat shock protein hsp12 protein n=1 Tax=Botryosphaeria parva (strain UCR-NP2) TaxID=1287680 RepID=R1GKW1_BOTPV|nr:putative chaperone heat shock protein hsp12 protein [Neofusicoccum parvum UCRNP2]